jgi:hypothetical protein
MLNDRLYFLAESLGFARARWRLNPTRRKALRIAYSVQFQAQNWRNRSMKGHLTCNSRGSDEINAFEVLALLTLRSGCCQKPLKSSTATYMEISRCPGSTIKMPWEHHRDALGAPSRCLNTHHNGGRPLRFSGVEWSAVQERDTCRTVND